MKGNGLAIRGARQFDRSSGSIQNARPEPGARESRRQSHPDHWKIPSGYRGAQPSIQQTAAGVPFVVTDAGSTFPVIRSKKGVQRPGGIPGTRSGASGAESQKRPSSLPSKGTPAESRRRPSSGTRLGAGHNSRTPSTRFRTTTSDSSLLSPDAKTGSCSEEQPWSRCHRTPAYPPTHRCRRAVLPVARDPSTNANGLLGHPGLRYWGIGDKHHRRAVGALG